VVLKLTSKEVAQLKRLQKKRERKAPKPTRFISGFVASITLEFPIELMTENDIRPLHRMQQAKLTKGYRTAVWGYWNARYGQKSVELPVVVTLTRIGRELDDDNLRGSLKGIRDQVADQLGVRSDRDPRITWRYAQQPGPSGVRIHITRRSEP
jgi:hypothetical protein